MITLVPYVKAEDGYTVTDEMVRNIWFKLVQDKTADIIFYDQGIISPEQFVAFFKSPANLPIVVLVENQIAGFAWLNGVAQGFAFAHFAFFKESWGKYTKEAGARILDYWLNLGEDKPVLRTIIGMVPEFNTRAIRFSEELGFKRVGGIPNLIESPIKEDPLNVVLLYYQR